MITLIPLAFMLTLMGVALFGKWAVENKWRLNYVWVAVIAWLLSSSVLFGLFSFSDGLRSGSHLIAALFIVFVSQAIALGIPCVVIFFRIEGNSPVSRLVLMVIPLTLLAALVFGVSDVVLSCAVFNSC